MIHLNLAFYILINGALVYFQDMANYTCIAENIAGKKMSDAVSLTVYGKYLITKIQSVQ